MTTVTVSPKYQVVIPAEVREQFKIKAGEKLRIVSCEGRIQLVPVNDIKTMRGFMKGISTDVKREKADRV